MRMARDDHTATGGCRSLGKLRPVVNDVNAHIGEPQGAPLRNARRPTLAIVVAANGVHGAQCAQLAQYCRRADVSRVDDAVRVLEEGFGLGSQQPMSV